MKVETTMRYSHIVEKRINLQKFLYVFVHVLYICPKSLLLSLKSFWKVFHWMVTIRRTMNWLMYCSCKSRQARVLLLKFKEEGYGRSKRKLGDSKDDNFALIVLVATSDLTVEIFAIKLGGAIADHIILYFFLVIGTHF